jgi:ADP-heptose:LPS heptosyltransferase
VAGNPNVSRIIPADGAPLWRQIPALRRTGYDVAVDFMCTPRTARLAFLSGATLRIGFRRRFRSLFYNVVVPRPMGDMYSASEKGLLLEPLGAAVDPPWPEFFESDGDRAAAGRVMKAVRFHEHRAVAAFSPVSRRAYKRWPLHHFARVCDHLVQKRGFSILPLFGPGEEEVIEELMRFTGFRQAFLYPYRPETFGAVMALLRHCTFYFGNDNGIRHLAVAADLPTAALFGTPNPLHWTPPGQPRHKYIWGKDRLDEVAPDRVIRMVEDLLGEMGGAPSSSAV